MKRAVGVSLLSISLMSVPAFAGETCKPVVGHFEAQLVLPPAVCTGILCTSGRVWGGLQGTYFFTMTTLQQSPTPLPISFFTGDSDVTTKSGDHVQGIDTGSIDLGPNGGFASLITFTGGTGALAGATGQIRLRGELNLAEGTTAGDYIGTLCTP